MIHQLVTQWQQSPKHLVIRLRCGGRESVIALRSWGWGTEGGDEIVAGHDEVASQGNNISKILSVPSFLL